MNTKPQANQFHNDASKSRYGDLFQYIMALEHCLNAPSDGLIYIEQRGDLANDSDTIEIKHHDSPKHTIAEKHIDFWKTIKNWTVNNIIIESYSKLILFTTSNITAGSQLIGWNSLTAEKKLEVLEEVRKDVFQNDTNKTIQPFIIAIFDFKATGYNKDKLLSILDRFIIISNQPRIHDKVTEIQHSNQFKYIPNKNRLPFIQELLSYIIFRCISKDLKSTDNQDLIPSESWVIRVSLFNAFAEEKMKHYVKDSTPILTTYRNHSGDSKSYSKYTFVREIERINYTTEIQDAVNNYHRAYLTTIDMADNNPTFLMAVQSLQEIMKEELILLKKLVCLEKDSSTKELAERNSQLCFTKSMALDIKPIESYEISYPFFQRGIIHQVVDAEHFVWHIEVKQP